MAPSATVVPPSRTPRNPAPPGIIPDGNRRWALARGLPESAGYDHGIEPWKQLFDVVWDLGIKEVSTDIFTKKNTHRPRDQVETFKAAFVKIIDRVENQEASVLLVGDTNSTVFPEGLGYLTVPGEGRARRRRLNLLVSYSWKWNVGEAVRAHAAWMGGDPLDLIGSRLVSRIDLVIR